MRPPFIPYKLIIGMDMTDEVYHDRRSFNSIVDVLAKLKIITSGLWHDA